jgi:uncharacterized phage protein (TIGR02220 family)
MEKESRGQLFSSIDNVEKVFEFWASKQKRPQVCKLTEERRKLIKNRMANGYTHEELILIIKYFYESNSDDARWMRGHNPSRRKYLGLDNLFRKKKLGDRLELAKNWEADLKEIRQDNFGPLAFFRAGRNGRN